MLVVGFGVLSIAACAAAVLSFPETPAALRIAVYLAFGAGMIGVLTSEERRWLLHPAFVMFHRARR